MYKNGFIKVELATINQTIGRPLENAIETLKILNNSQSAIVLFPELSLSGYTAADLFYEKSFLDESLEALKEVIDKTTYKGVYIVGLPLLVDEVLFNAAIVIQDKKILGAIPKKFIPNYKEFYEKRWFQAGMFTQNKEITILGQKVLFGDMIFENSQYNVKFGVEICQDLWTTYAPSDLLALNGAHLLFNLSASTEHINKVEGRRSAVIDHSRKQISGYFYTSCGSSESTTDVVYSNHKLAAVLGEVIGEKDFFNKDETLVVDVDVDAIKHQRRVDMTYADQKIGNEKNIPFIPFTITESKTYQFEKQLDKTPFIPKNNTEYQFRLASAIQTEALKTKLRSVNNLKIVIGISGGLDSTLALLTAYKAIKELNRDPKDVIGITMPAEATSNRSKNDAVKLMEKLNITQLVIPIKKEVETHLELLNHNHEDTTYENTQARIRTMILMNTANKENAFVLGTGDMSEIALGWMTFNGDHMSMYNVNAGLPKIWVKALVEYYAENEFKDYKNILESIYNAPISPELKKEQKTEDEVGLYEINDFIMYHFLVNGKDKKQIKWLLENTFGLTNEQNDKYIERFFKRFYTQQFKRQPMPEGPKVLSISLSPRGELRLPSDIKRK
ncbi:NAD(+) synthase, glutamine-dependent [Alteracholeplasma palmae J233]|uniref:Glutamine-dependent NAD(+) synthetase n=1 Tax=Alteracholeplasma palmae (strain ATCC 49389 / J233) TaxID=1318466 RepID=U4KLA3_ALTPJ|nr:NAD(+) synthase [Alteracholeplasma palmae]CCV64558.1 NAD(+) synthase, glutamine-dependent [Alteracholeplasma palmae J233]